MTIRSKLKQLERVARQLEPTKSQRLQARTQVINYTEHFLDTLESRKAYRHEDDSGIGLLDSPISEKPISIKQALSLVRKNVDFPALNPASGGHLGYIPGGGLYYASLGDYMVAITNRYAGVFYVGPGAVRMENMLLRWAALVVGYPATAAGNITSGGSLANLIGICTARDAKKITSSRVSSSVIYMTEQAHHSLAKAIRIAGLGECIVRNVPMDSNYRMDADALEMMVKRDLKSKLNPFLLVASAGTTDTGSIDPLASLGLIARKHKLWYHVDAAYGGFFALTKEGKGKLAGMEMSDSLVIDPHKGLFLPYGIGMLLVKDRKQLNATHYYQANYMQDALPDSEEPSPADLSPELTKHFRGLRMWLPLKLHGVNPFRACLEEKLLLAKYFHSEVKRIGFETGPEPELSVVTYRFVPKNGDANVSNRKLLHAVQKDGRVFISSTMLGGKFTLRFACLSFRTHTSTVDILLQVLKSELARLEKRK